MCVCDNSIRFAISKTPETTREEVVASAVAQDLTGMWVATTRTWHILLRLLRNAEVDPMATYGTRFGSEFVFFRRSLIAPNRIQQAGSSGALQGRNCATNNGDAKAAGLR